MKRPIHFEIHADDPARAAKFYSTLFGWDIKKWESPGFKTEMDYWLIMTGKEGTSGINGGLLRRQGPSPEANAPIAAFVCTIDVPSLDETMKAITANGGMIALEKMPIPGMGWLAYGKDTEGNTFGVMEEDKSAK